MRIPYLAILAVLLLICTKNSLIRPAIAQTATYSGGSIYDLKPPMRQSTGNRHLEALILSKRQHRMKEIREYPKRGLYRRLARPVGRLAMAIRVRGGGEAVGYCTVSLIDKSLILTNYHCIAGNDEGRVTDALLWMGFVDSRHTKGVKKYGVELKPVEASKSLDYAIHKVRGQPGKPSAWGTISLGNKISLYDRQSLFIIHHPAGVRQHISLGNCQAGQPATEGNDLLHVCDTIGGSSGAPVFESETRKVVGLHYSAVDIGSLNAAKRMDKLVKQSPILQRLMHSSNLAVSPKRNNTATSLLQDKTNSLKFENKQTVQEIYLQGKKHYSSKRYKEAMLDFRKGVSQGSYDSMNALGWMYQNGQGVTKSFTKAKDLFKKAAADGSSEAMYNLAMMYANGIGIMQNRRQAAHWYDQAVNRGHAGAMSDLGTLYLNGQGVPFDPAKALRLFQKARGLGLARAKTKIGIMYIQGRGVKKNIVKAIRLLHDAAEERDAQAMLLLSTLYDKGIGVKRNQNVAIKWIVKALATGDKEIREILRNNRSDFSIKVRRALLHNLSKEKKQKER